MNEHEIIISIRNMFAGKSYHDRGTVVVETEVRIKDYRADLIVKAGRRIIAVFEIKRELEPPILNMYEDALVFSGVPTRYVVITDGVGFLLYDRFSLHRRRYFEKIGEVVDIILTPISAEYIHSMKQGAVRELKEQAERSKEKFPRFAEYLAESDDEIVENLILDYSYALAFAKTEGDISEIENNLFSMLLYEDDSKLIYRYSGLESVFRTLNEGTVAMQGLYGMNDTTEVNYIENYMNDSADAPWELNAKTREEMNHRYIISCTKKEDDLMFWRLYGDDAKGACLEYEVMNTGETSGFFLYKVRYPDTHGNHPELDVIKAVAEAVSSKYGVKLKFNALHNIWCHFFKPREYEYENEVRLLYLDGKSNAGAKRDWILARPYGIANTMLVFNLNTNPFPLKLKRVVLGSKMSEKHLNRSQLEQLRDEKGESWHVELSKCNVYR